NPLPGTRQSVYGVPVVNRVNDFWNTTLGSGIKIAGTTGWVAEVIWQDRDSRVIDFCSSTGTGTEDNFAGTGSERFYFKPRPGAWGNVLIGVRLKTGGDGYLWSWHLWITGYNPDEAPSSWQENVFAYTIPGGGQVHHYTGGSWNTTAYTNKFIMDRNLGAASADRSATLAATRGLYYQFGRKDPFPATHNSFSTVTLYNIAGQNGKTGNVAIPITENQSSFEGAVKNPTTFYAPPGSGDWLLNNDYYTALWNNPSTWNTISAAGKSFFDPCPPGWKLPINGTWNMFAIGNVNNPSNYNSGGNDAGWEFYMDNVLKNAWAYYPASAMGTDRVAGYCWSSTPINTTHCHHLSFFAATMFTQGMSVRGSGFPVRCVQEE
ncbi:MAG: hypothetical protein LBP56_01510, partial [Odoribacteraceae bacterium]|nr:hypothetical protein [Odoribacteraceae bacterium]